LLQRIDRLYQQLVLIREQQTILPSLEQQITVLKQQQQQEAILPSPAYFFG
jgi:hypothetical protein